MTKKKTLQSKYHKKFPKLIKNTPYEIEWIDTFGYSSWFSEEEIDKKINQSSTCLVVGYFVKEKDGFIVLTMGRETHNSDFAPYNTPKFIPKGCIKSIKKLWLKSKPYNQNK